MSIGLFVVSQRADGREDHTPTANQDGHRIGAVEGYASVVVSNIGDVSLPASNDVGKSNKDVALETQQSRDTNTEGA